MEKKLITPVVLKILILDLDHIFRDAPIEVCYA